MTIAQELEKRLFILSDYKVRWVRQIPYDWAQSCLISSFSTSGFYDHLSTPAIRRLDDFINCYYYSFSESSRFMTVNFNDQIAKTREEVIWMLEEAVDQAKWEGV